MYSKKIKFLPIMYYMHNFEILKFFYIILNDIFLNVTIWFWKFFSYL